MELAKKLVCIFLQGIMEVSKWTFWQTQKLLRKNINFGNPKIDFIYTTQQQIVENTMFEMILFTLNIKEIKYWRIKLTNEL